MDTAKIKNFIIIVLALVNVFMLVLVLADRNEAKSAQKSAREDIIQVLSDNGIKLSGGVKISGSEPEAFNLLRDLDKEKKMVSALLGKVSVKDLGGNIYYYSGANGQANFRGTGEFEMLLDTGTISAGGDPIQAARRALRKMGIDSDKKSAKLELMDGGESVTVTLNATWQGDVIYNCRFSFVFTGGSLTLVMGRRPLDRINSRADEEMLSVATVLMRFIDMINAGGYVCSEIRTIERGFVMNISAPGDSTLCPVWKIETDAGGYYINGMSGKAEILSN